MFDYMFWLLAKVRDEILDGLVIPGLDMSYWDFCIYLAIATVVAIVLLNGVRIGGISSSSSSKEEKYRDVLRERERVKVSARNQAISESKQSPKVSSDIELFEKMLNRPEE